VTPLTVLLDGSFLDALADQDHEFHAAAEEIYRSLLDSYEQHELRVRARTDHLRHHSQVRRTLFAPIETISVARQYARAGAHLERTADVAADAAVTLVVMKRERIRRIATFDPTFSDFDDLEVVRRATTEIEPPTAPPPTES